MKIVYFIIFFYMGINFSWPYDVILTDIIIQEKSRSSLVSDSLLKKSFETLEAEFYDFREDTLLAKTYAKAYLAKGKLKKDTLKIANGYDLVFKTEIDKYDTAIKYADSIIFITTDKDYKKYPTRGFLYKGYLFKKFGKYNKSLNFYLEGLRLAKLKDDAINIIALRHNIALLKSTLKKNNEAITMLKENLIFIKKQDTVDDYRSLHLVTLLQLSDSYNRQKIFDSAIYYQKIGVAKSLSKTPNYYYPEFLMDFGISNYFTKNYQTSIDSLSKAKNLFKKNVNTSALLYLSKSLLKTNRSDEAIIYLKKIDSIVTDSNYSFEIRDAFTLLIDHYDKINSQNEQLRIMQKLIKFDSIANDSYRKLNINIVKNYDEVQLISRKDKLIRQIEDNNDKKVYRIIIFSSIIIIGLSMFYIFIYRKKKVKFRKEIEEKLQKIETLNSKKSNSKELDISAEITEEILEKLVNFEQNLGFLENKLTQNKVAKDFKTNSTYLSYIINKNKNKNFANYINDLRIEYCVEKMNTDKKFRQYSIESMAKEVGFNSIQSFATAFNKKTGVNPSYYLKTMNIN